MSGNGAIASDWWPFPTESINAVTPVLPRTIARNLESVLVEIVDGPSQMHQVKMFCALFAIEKSGSFVLRAPDVELID
jgi:hypothetical protein